MSNYQLLKFDFVLSRHPSTVFAEHELDQILNSICELHEDKINCLNFFVSQGILQENTHSYYYTLNKTPMYGTYKNLPIIRSKIQNQLSDSINFSQLSLN